MILVLEEEKNIRNIDMTSFSTKRNYDYLMLMRLIAFVNLTSFCRLKCGAVLFRGKLHSAITHIARAASMKYCEYAAVATAFCF